VSAAAQPVAWRLLLVPAALQALLHVLTNGNYGIFRDEYYYLACASRLDWGYVDQPPLSILVLAAWRALFGDGVHALRILPTVCGATSIVLAGAIAAELGGRRWAQLAAGVGVGVGAAGLALCGFYSMNGFDLLFWMGAYYLLARVLRTGDARVWPSLGLWLGLGLVNKVGLLVFGAALAIALVATGERRWLRRRETWLAGAIALAMLAPYVLWNAAHGWPTVEFIVRAKRDKIAGASPLAFLQECVLEANPLVLPVWLGGLVWLLASRRRRDHRVLGLTFLATLVLMIVQKSKAYYLAPSFPVLVAAGGVAWERWTESPRWRWARGVLLVLLLVGGAVLAPIAVPLFSPARTVAYMQALHIVPQTGEVGAGGALPQYFSDRFGWEELARTTSAVYATLDAGERARCVAIGENYGHAGALEYWSRRYELPPVHSGHNNYALWGPPPAGTDVVIAVGFHRDDLVEGFDEVREAARSRTPDARESDIPILVCKGPRFPWTEMWPRFCFFI